MKIILDSSGMIYSYLLQNNFKVEKEVGYSYISFKNCKVFFLPSINYFLNKERIKYFPVEEQERAKKIKTSVLKLLHLVQTKYFPIENKKEESFSEIIVSNSKNKKFKLVKELPNEKEEGVEYITLDSAKDLCRIFDVIDNIEM